MKLLSARFVAISASMALLAGLGCQKTPATNVPGNTANSSTTFARHDITKTDWHLNKVKEIQAKYTLKATCSIPDFPAIRPGTLSVEEHPGYTKYSGWVDTDGPMSGLYQERQCWESPGFNPTWTAPAYTVSGICYSVRSESLT